MSPSDLKSDIAYMRDLAEAGEQAPLIGGRFLVIWGGLSSIACIIHWALLAGHLPITQWALPAVWAGNGLVGMILTSFMARGLSHKPGARSIGNRASRAAWQFVGIGIVFYVFGIAVSVSALDAEPILFDSILTVALFGYAIAFSVTAALSGQKWLYGPAWMSIAGAALSPAFYGRPELYLLCAAIIFFAALVPGVRMMRNEPKALV